MVDVCVSDGAICPYVLRLGLVLGLGFGLGLGLRLRLGLGLSCAAHLARQQLEALPRPPVELVVRLDQQAGQG